MSIKVLPLSSYCSFIENYTDDEIVTEFQLHHDNSVSVYGKNGYYYNRYTKHAWIEVNNKAYNVPVSGFRYNLSLHDAEEMGYTEADICKLDDEKVKPFLTKNAMQRINVIKDYRSIRDTYRKTRLYMIRSQKQNG